jgi:hypothetical protein
MNSMTLDESQPVSTRRKFAAPIWTLLVLAPFIAEVLSGSTRVSILFVFIPEVMVWGVGALFCRELVRRWRAGGVSLLLLGFALSIAEEFIIQQTSLAPLPFTGSHPGYGRMWGVNLVYFLFMLGYESVWVVMVPVQLTELFFPQEAKQPWLKKRGAILGGIIFLLGSRIAWYGWTQQARPRLHAAPYHPPAEMIALGFLAIALLVVLAYLIRGVGQPSPDDRRKTVPAWLAGLTAFVMGAAWFELIGQSFVARPVQPFWIALFAGVAWAGLTFTLFVWWSSRPAWKEAHRFAAAFGATLACMAMPYLGVASWPTIDLAGKSFFDILALAGFFVLARKVFARMRTESNPASGAPS